MSSKGLEAGSPREGRAARGQLWAHVVAFVAGVVFAVGLALSRMTQPAKVVGFLDFTGSGGRWDPSLMFVMGGGLLVLLVAQWVARTRAAPAFAACFPTPAKSDIDARLVGGAALFGLGWGLAGYCPGPAVVAFGVGVKSAVVLLPAMLLGILLVQRLDAWRNTEPGLAADETGAPGGAAAGLLDAAPPAHGAGRAAGERSA